VGDGTGVSANCRDPHALANLAYYPLALRDALSLPGVVLVVAVASRTVANDGPELGPLPERTPMVPSLCGESVLYRVLSAPPPNPLPRPGP